MRIHKVQVAFQLSRNSGCKLVITMQISNDILPGVDV